MPFIYAFNIRELVQPVLQEMMETNPAYHLYAPFDLFRWWLSVAIERMCLIECQFSNPPDDIYPYVDFVCLDKLLSQFLIYPKLISIVRPRAYNNFILNLNSNYDGFLILDH